MQIENYISGCNRCQRMKSFSKKPAGKLKPNEATSQPWKDITTDIRFSVRVWYNLVLLTISSHTEVENKALSGCIISCQSGIEVSVAGALPLRLAPYEQCI